MDRVARKIIKMLLSDKKSGGVFYTQDLVDKVCDELKISDIAFISCLQHLRDKGLINFDEDKDYFFTLEHKIYHRWWFAWDAFRWFIIKSVLVPILVSILTTYALWALGLIGR